MFQSSAFDPEQPGFNPVHFERAAQRAVVDLQRVVGGPAQRALGLQYATGDGVTKDQAQALLWCRRAAEQGDAVGQYFLGLSYMSGDGVPRNAPEGVRWFRLAANQGDLASQYNLAIALMLGDGVPRDEDEALVWFGVAAAAGDAQARHDRDLLRAKLGPDRAAAAQFRAETIQAKLATQKRAP